MNVIVTIDDANGTMFNHRRQSRDRVLNERILKVCSGRLRVTPETAALFAGMQTELTVTPDPLAGAGAGVSLLPPQAARSSASSRHAAIAPVKYLFFPSFRMA